MSQGDFAAKAAWALNFRPLWDDFPLILGAFWAANRDLPAGDAFSHGGSGPGMRAWAVIRVGVSGFCFASLCLPALPSLFRGNLRRNFGSKIDQKSIKKGCSRYWHSTCHFSVGFLIHLVHFHIKFGQRRTLGMLKNY